MLTGPRVLHLLAGHDVSAWWRVTRPVHHLAAAGYPCAWARWDEVDRSTLGKDWDAVVLPRIYWADREYGANAASELKAQGLTVLYEVDDDWYSPGVSERLVEVHPEFGTLPEQEQARDDRRYALSLMDGVIVSTDPLAEVCRRLTDKPVVTVRSAIDAEWWADKLRDHERLVPGLTVGWVGGARKEEDLDQVAVAWGRIAERYPDVQFVVSGVRPGGVARFVPPERVWPIPWQDLDAHPRSVANIDIACASVADNAWNACKSSIKPWEATLSGAAVVASPLLYLDCVAGRGLIAQSANQWTRALSTMIEQPDFRAQSVREMRLHVDLNHTLATQAQTWPAAWAALVEASRKVAV